MRRIWIVAVACAAAVASSALAFEEQKMRPAHPQSGQPVQGVPQGGVSLSEPGITVPRVDAGTKIRVPGLGAICEIPKMDFGLELLYGASQPKASDVERSDGNGVMGRVTVPIRPSR